MSKSWVLDVHEGEDGDKYIILTDEILKDSGFQIGDNLSWKDNGDGSWTLTKKQDKVWVLVECVSTFRMRYMVEAPADHPEYALDDVTMETAKEFSQEHLGEQIVSHRVLTEKEAIQLCDVDNNYCDGWTKDQKIKAFFTKEGEKKDY